MTLRVTLPRHDIIEEPLNGERTLVASKLGGLVPIGWQPNPLISGEAAAMCQTDYKSAPRRMRARQTAASTKVRVLVRRALGEKGEP